MDATLTNPATGRLSVQTVERLHRLLGGDPHVEDLVMDYIEFRWKGRNLFYIPEKFAREILKRPADFIQVAKHHCEPELPF